MIARVGRILPVVAALLMLTGCYFRRHSVDGPIYADSKGRYAVVIETTGIRWPRIYSSNNETVLSNRVAILRITSPIVDESLAVSITSLGARDVESPGVRDQPGGRNFILLREAAGLVARTTLTPTGDPGSLRDDGGRCGFRGLTGVVIPNPGYYDSDEPACEASKVSVFRATDEHLVCTLDLIQIAGAILKAEALAGETDLPPIPRNVSEFLDQFQLEAAAGDFGLYAYARRSLGPTAGSTRPGSGKVYFLKGCRTPVEVGRFKLEPSEEIVALDPQPRLTVLTRSDSKKPGIDMYRVRILGESRPKELPMETSMAVFVDARHQVVFAYNDSGTDWGSLTVRGFNYATGAVSTKKFDLARAFH